VSSNGLAYSARAVSYAREMFMKLIPRVSKVLSVAKVFPFPSEEVVAGIAVEVPAEAANFVPEFRRDRQFQEADAVPQKSDA
jgi:hypothetical protein